MLQVILPVLSTLCCIFNLIAYEESKIFRLNEGTAGSNTLQQYHPFNFPDTVILILSFLLLQYEVKMSHHCGKLR
jgi:hypothetical protein